MSGIPRRPGLDEAESPAPGAEGLPGGRPVDAGALAPTAIDPAVTKEDPPDPWATQVPGGMLAGPEIPVIGPGGSAFGEYEILEEIARGGMGVVYKARQVRLNRIVALKRILAGQLASEADVLRFRREAEAAAHLDHPGIVQVFEVGEHGGEHYFSMRYVEGQSLSTRVSAGPLPPREAAGLVVEIALAIDYAHRRGILHRDLKPQNILLDRSGRPHVTDFGLAKILDRERSVTGTGDILGTPSYMPPEQAAGRIREIGPAADVYSLGAILYCLVTGRPPFAAARPLDTVMQVLEDDPAPPRSLNRQVDPDLEMIITKCLQKSPSLRYQSAADLARDLNAYLDDEQISVRSARLAEVWSRLLRTTHQAVVLENWGLLWMIHGVMLLVLCLLTNLLARAGTLERWPYLALWTIVMGLWAPIFWQVRRHAGPITFVEWKLFHLWAGSVISIVFIFLFEISLGLPVLSLAPLIAVTGGSVFLAKAAMLSGTFYLQAAALYLTAGIMLLVPGLDLAIMGVVMGLCFFVPGFRQYVRRD
jgi:eukaryotic-like serine/threonine-protein kinase